MTFLFIFLDPNAEVVMVGWFSISLSYRQVSSPMLMKLLTPLNCLFAAANKDCRAVNIANHIGSVKCARANGACHVWWKSHCPHLRLYSWSTTGDCTLTLHPEDETLSFVQRFLKLNDIDMPARPLIICVCRLYIVLICVPVGCSHYRFSFRAMLERQAWLPWQAETSFQTLTPFVTIWLMPSRRWRELLSC
jgi:hypothetical protein